LEIPFVLLFLHFLPQHLRQSPETIHRYKSACSSIDGVFERRNTRSWSSGDGMIHQKEVQVAVEVRYLWDLGYASSPVHWKLHGKISLGLAG
jgi:hypothetical protein